MQVYNTLTREKAPLTPIEPGKIRMYVCGMTVYDYCHLGHARVLVAFDVITRYLRAKGFDVTYVRNITDVDDKIIARAQENGESIDALTGRMIDAMHEDERKLFVLAPNREPRATEHIDDIITMVSTLIDKGYAYAADNGDVYYRVRKFDGYGKLNNRAIDDMLSGARVEVEFAKADPLDFVLWKAAKPGESAWESPWGPGRPGWHIECSAMSTCCLGNNFDIHGGGPDLTFPHHENEIAQSEAATGETYANVWMHAGALRVNDEKMSKSLGNFFTIRDVLEVHDPEVVRYLLVSSHYRSAINYAPDALDEARRSLERLYNALDGVDLSSGAVESRYSERFHRAMDDDFNTPEAMAVLFELARDINRAKKGGGEAGALASELRRLASLLGLLNYSPSEFLKGAQSALEITEDEIEAQIQARNDARKAKDFAEADRIRDALAEKGIILKDSREGTGWVVEQG
ncbi:cysteine--tRNA ligase [Larsenimonas suaedae]|uniref:Cysteine--tRNA ligase n=1 Tax=Larsenimonas suaedae TaxID=1851019 RepID=A0ABU1GT60_9GAMM|nr:cysteine--tRNA ligase [Larsenimonas suaedae]MCM2971670.1 cysteine--tRNA ligase [Larsenimonas suaedae]MDR5895222.1 cysteine--tRNA ligase [Larsenimonas suaedae]